MRKEINWRNLQTSGLQVRWECRRGHEEADDTPLPRTAYCQKCDAFYEWSEVSQRGPLVQLPVEPMPAGLVAGG